MKATEAVTVGSIKKAIANSNFAFSSNYTKKIAINLVVFYRTSQTFDVRKLQYNHTTDIKKEALNELSNVTFELHIFVVNEFGVHFYF